MELIQLTIDSTRNAVQERKTTAFALAEAHYARIQREDGQIGAFLTLCKERALEHADRIDRMAAEGKPLPPLGGVPVAIKDVMSTRGLRTTAGSKMLGNYIAPYDCTAVVRMEAAGAVIL
ncbi:MAG: amidase family protein, partial [Candidatus Acidiferrales bacterium]